MTLDEIQISICSAVITVPLFTSDSWEEPILYNKLTLIQILIQIQCWEIF